MTKKLVVSVLGLVLLLPATGFAQSTSDIQSMINAIMQQIAALQQQVNQQNQNGGGGSATPTLPQEKTETVKYGQVISACRELRNTLRAGNKGQDVAYLHMLLQKEGFTIDSGELASQEYGESTASSVTGLQEKYRSEILAPVGLKYGSGLVGASTRKKLNALYNCVKPIETKPPVPAGQPPVISGVSGPTTIKVGEIGVWKISATGNYNDYLSYSVVWGDEVAYATGSGVSSKQVVSQSATFEHSYQSAGTYNPVFYVTNQNGQSAKASISVQVGGSTEIVTEQVKCVFEGDSTNKQNCYFASNSSNSSDYNALGCSGIGACVVDLKGIRGETRSWKSSCGGYATTTMDGQNEYAKFSCGTVTQPILQVLSPNGGESWQMGARQTIKWSAPSSVSDVKIALNKLYECNSSVGTTCTALYSTQVMTIAEKALNTGFYEWSVPATLAAGRYTVTIYNSANLTSSDESNAPFAIVGVDKTYHPADTNKDLRITISEVTAYGNGQYAASAQNIWRNGEVYKWDPVKQDWVPTAAQAPSITIISPNGGESWQTGTKNYITWKSANLGSLSVIIQLADANGMPLTSADMYGNVAGVIASMVPNTGYYAWTIPSDFKYVGSYKIMVGSADKGPSASDVSDAAFVIVADKTYHPADTNKDLRITISEVTAYGNGQYAASAQNIWRNGEVYKWDPVKQDWVPTAVSGSILSISRDVSYVGGQTFTRGTAGAKIASFSLTASSARDVQVNSISLVCQGCADVKSYANDLGNIRLWAGNQQVGPNVNPVMTFPSIEVPVSNGWVLPAGSTVNLVVLADIMPSSSPGEVNFSLGLKSLTGPGQVIGLPAYAPSNKIVPSVVDKTYHPADTNKDLRITINEVTAYGNGPYAASAANIWRNGEYYKWDESKQDWVPTGPPIVQTTVRVTNDAANAPMASQVVMGATGVKILALNLTETSNAGDVKVTELKIHQNSAGAKSGISNVSLYKGTERIAVAGYVDGSSADGYYYKFVLGSPLVLPRNSSISLTVKADVLSYASGSVTDNSKHIFSIRNISDISAVSSASNTASIIQLGTDYSAPVSNPLNVIRTKINVSASPLGVTSNRIKTMADDLGNIIVSADPAGTAVLNDLTVTFGGTAPSSLFLDGVKLFDSNMVDVASSYGATVNSSAPCTGQNTCSKTWHFPSGVNGWVIPAGASSALKLRVDSTKTAAGTGVAQSLQASISSNTDVKYTDGLDPDATTGLTLPINLMPIGINYVAYMVGSVPTASAATINASSQNQMANTLDTMRAMLEEMLRKLAQ